MMHGGHNMCRAWLAATGFAAGLVFSAGAAPVATADADAFATMKISRSKAVTEAPVFHLKTLDGQEIDSGSLRGKVVVLNFWATWCGPCKEEMPSLERLRRSFDPKQVVLLAVTTDLERTGIRAFMKQLDLTFPVLMDEDRDVSTMFMVRGLPTTVLIGRDGTLIGRAVGPRAWDSPQSAALVNELLK
jgi:thiol-disulfide isomerase/thioredoxin